MKKIIGITSIIATLISPATFATGAVDGACRKLNREILEMPLGGPLKSMDNYSRQRACLFSRFNRSLARAS